MLIQKRLPNGKYGPRHGLTGSRLQQLWSGMIQRCSNPKNKGYPHYGGRGITVCPEWQDFIVFRDWALTHGYQPDLSIDRVDNDGHYEPGNVRFTTRKVQMNNTSTNRRVIAFGETKTVSEWSEDPRCTVSYRTLLQRVDRDKMDPELAMTRSLKPRGPHAVTIFGATKILAAWARDPRCVVTRSLFVSRLRRGWSPEQALTLQAQHG